MFQLDFLDFDMRYSTEKVGGTETSPPVSFASDSTAGMIKLAFGAGGCARDDAKKVACSVADSKGLAPEYHFDGNAENALAYWPSRPVCIRLSNCRMNVPGLANNGMNRVTSLMCVQMIPSPRVGSGVDVRQTDGILM